MIEHHAGRYFLQAAQELPSEWTLMKSGQPGVPELDAWLSTTLQDGQVVGVDASLISAKEAKGLKASLAAKNIRLVGECRAYSIMCFFVVSF